MQTFFVQKINTIPVINSINTNNNSSYKLISSIEYWLNKYYISVKTVVEVECKNYLVKSDGKNWQCSFLLLSDQDPNDSTSFHCLCKHFYQCEDKEEFFLDLSTDYVTEIKLKSNIKKNNANLLSQFDENGMYDLQTPVSINELCEESINQLTAETTWNCNHVNKIRDNDYYYNEYDDDTNKNTQKEIYCQCNRSKLCQFDKIINFNSI
jgi:hypothetical protein